MTCRNSFYHSLLENLKRRLWLPAVIMLYFFLSYPISSALSLSTVNIMGDQTVYGTLQETFMSAVTRAPLPMCALFAIMCAMQGFSYLHKKNRVDMYHSVPVSKCRQYTVVCLNGLLIYLVPYVLNLLLTYLIGAAYGAATLESVLIGMRAFGYSMLLYLMVYFTAVIAMMLTGNGVIAFILSWILLLYEPMMQSLKEVLETAYFHTYVEGGEYHFVTPIAMYLEAVIFPEVLEGNSVIALSTLLTDIAKMSAYVIIACLLGYLFYKKRPSESCAKALAFSKSKPLFKFLLVIPFGVLMGAAFYGIANEKLPFALLGITLGVAIAHCVLEVVYEFDIWSIINHKLQLLILFGVTCVCYSIFQFDLFGYDRYIPAESSVKSAYIEMVDVDRLTDFYDEEWDYQSKAEHLENNMYLTDIQTVQEIAAASWQNDSDTEIEREIFCTIAYRMKDGRMVKRSYFVDYDECKEQLAAVYESAEYKNGAYEYCEETEDVRAGNIRYQIGGMDEIEITSVSWERIMELYQEEMKHLTLKETVSENPVGVLYIEYEVSGGIGEKTYSYPVYPSFTKVRAELLKEEALQDILENGISTDNGIYAEDVEALEIVGQDEYAGVSVMIENQMQIREVLNSLHFSYNANSVFESSVLDGEYLVFIRMKENTVYTYQGYYSADYYFKEGEVPAFIIKDMEDRKQK